MRRTNANKYLIQGIANVICVRTKQRSRIIQLFIDSLYHGIGVTIGHLEEEVTNKTVSNREIGPEP
jgi:hypothetical protein